ncbi:hypothetical protein LPB138_06390 [Urechidicola croceus]|uniref:CHASE2 domain-containing protein n=1 Tax=Urechidicola croceus TaxID=1850246 RepID=A0A1D8P6Y0_9FLAO|nr:hypothetical protein LPB138_06390 [Urechidicola croceus]
MSLLFLNISFFNPLKKAVKDFSFLDVYYSESLGETTKISPKIIIINIEQKDRFQIAQLLQNLIKSNPKVIGLDIIFKEKKEVFSDSILASALNSDKVVQSYLIENKKIINNDPIFHNNKSKGYINLNFDSKTNVIREFIGIKKIDNKIYNSFSTEITKKFLEDKWEEFKYDKRLTKNKSIKYQGQLNSFLTFGFDEFELLDNKSIVKDKIVLLGYLGTPTGNIYDIEDKHFTPLNKEVAGKSIPDMNGIIVHANIINMLINNDFMFQVSDFWIGIFSFLFSFICIMYFIWLDKKNMVSFMSIKKLVLFIFTVVLMWFSLWLFKKGIVLKTTIIIATTLLSCAFIPYYKYLIKKIQTKIKWKSFFQ